MVSPLAQGFVNVITVQLLSVSRNHLTLSFTKKVSDPQAIIQTVAVTHCGRPYHREYIRTSPISEVKPGLVQGVLGWATTWERWMLYVLGGLTSLQCLCSIHGANCRVPDSVESRSGAVQMLSVEFAMPLLRRHRHGASVHDMFNGCALSSASLCGPPIVSMMMCHVHGAYMSVWHGALTVTNEHSRCWT